MEQILGPSQEIGSIATDYFAIHLPASDYCYTGADSGFGQGGAPAFEAKSCRRSETESREHSEPLAAGVQGPLKGPGNFWVFNAQIWHSPTF